MCYSSLLHLANISCKIFSLKHVVRCKDNLCQIKGQLTEKELGYINAMLEPSCIVQAQYRKKQDFFFPINLMQISCPFGTVVLQRFQTVTLRNLNQLGVWSAEVENIWRNKGWELKPQNTFLCHWSNCMCVFRLPLRLQSYTHLFGGKSYWTQSNLWIVPHWIASLWEYHTRTNIQQELSFILWK